MSSNTNTTTNETFTGTTRPKRQAGINGETNRRQTNATNKQIDASINKDMGNANHMFTNTGHVRFEYLGR